MLTKNGGGDHRRRLSRVHYIVQCTVYNVRWRNNALQTMLWIHSTPTFCWQSVTCGFLKYISFYLHWDFVWICPRRPIWLNSTLAWHPSGNVSLSEPLTSHFTDAYIDGLVQNRSISSAIAMEILQSCTKPSICQWVVFQGLHVSAMLSQNINEVIMVWFDKHN